MGEIMRKHSVTPLEEMEVVFLDKTLLFRFDMEAILKMQNEFGDLKTLAENNSECELIAIMFYSGIKNSNITLDEARVIISSNALILADTLEVILKSLEVLGGEEVSKKMKEDLVRIQAKTTK